MSAFGGKADIAETPSDPTHLSEPIHTTVGIYDGHFAGVSYQLANNLLHRLPRLIRRLANYPCEIA
jgi:hypothetical protein